MLLATLFLLCIYWAFILYAVIGWKKAVKHSSIQSLGTVGIDLDVVVCYRNEAENLKSLIQDLSNLEGTIRGVRFIFVNDGSEDEGPQILDTAAKDLCILNIDSRGKGKKSAIKEGLAHSRTEKVLFWDADIRVNAHYFEGIKNLPDMDLIILPVHPSYLDKFWSRYAALDFHSLIGMTYGWAAHGRPIMANGANLLVRKSRFNIQEHTASGDDMQALHAIKDEGGSIGYSLDPRLEVKSLMAADFKEFFHQRLRWAAKSKTYSDSDTLAVGWFLVVFQIVFLSMLAALTCQGNLAFAMVLFIGKISADLLFLHLITNYFRDRALMKIFPFAIFVNLLMMPLIYIASRLMEFKWKGRSYRQ